MLPIANLSTAILTDGFAVIDNAISQETFKKLQQLSKLYIDRTNKRHNNSGNLLYNLFKTENLLYDFLCPELINNNDLYNTAKDILGANFSLKEILIFYSYPNNDKQELHSDLLPYFQEQDISLPPTVLAAQFPLNDFNFSSGGTRLVANTQNSFDKVLSIEEEALSNSYQIVTPVVNKKSCLLRDCRVWHGAGINLTDNIRAMFTLVFVRSWCNPKYKVSKDLYFCIDKEKRHLVAI